jgi:hypothetical protein
VLGPDAQAATVRRILTSIEKLLRDA